MRTLIAAALLGLFAAAPLQASCTYHEQQASSCAEGQSRNAETGACETTVTG
ncbi:hypothetical protein [Oceanicola sp. S124]|uniref:hypothetical protein n=1 Tax=Oceanicola sp. S124 TaxID=1042378 RepID=UPI0002FFADA9|nr:hypothetical protein [Oceanicola sp. S124]